MVTGGNPGIGLATAILFVDQGAQVIVAAQSSETFTKAKKEFGKISDVVEYDVSDLAALDSLLPTSSKNIIIWTLFLQTLELRCAIPINCRSMIKS